MKQRFNPRLAPKGYKAVKSESVSNCKGCAFEKKTLCGEGRPCSAHERPDGCWVIFVPDTTLPAPKGTLTDEQINDIGSELMKLFPGKKINYHIAQHIIQKDLFDHTSLEGSYDVDEINKNVIWGAMMNILFKYHIDN